MPTNILHPRGVLGICSDNRIFFLQTSIEHFDFPICKASDKSLGGSMIRYKGSNWTVRVGVQILVHMLSINKLDGLMFQTHQTLSLCLSIPYFDNMRVSSDQQSARRLLPIGHNTASLPQLDHLVETAESADHLNRPLVKRRIIVSIKADDAFSCFEVKIQSEKIGVAIPEPVTIIPPTS